MLSPLLFVAVLSKFDDLRERVKGGAIVNTSRSRAIASGSIAILPLQQGRGVGAHS
jgi:hypothetical protein